MRSFALLTDALAYIDENLEAPLTPDGIAAACFCSVSGLQKLFRYALHLGVKEYVERRRLTVGARQLLRGMRVLEVALRYQYQSPEVFTRAFRRLWGMTPSAFRRTWRFSGLHPKVEGIIEGGDGYMRTKLDISELYEALLEKAGTYVLCFDIVGLLGINEISHAAGDQVILECLRRIDAAAPADMLLFRIGGDEFALVTGLSTREAVDAIAQPVLAQNGTPVVHEGREIPVSLRAGAMRIARGSLRYAELFDRLLASVDKATPGDRVSFAGENE